MRTMISLRRDNSPVHLLRTIERRCFVVSFVFREYINEIIFRFPFCKNFVQRVWI